MYILESIIFYEISKMSMKVLFLSCLLLLSISCNSANQVSNLKKLIKAQRHQKPLQSSHSQNGLNQVGVNTYSPEPHDVGSKEADKIDALPGQPTEGVDFDQYAGYVTVDDTAGRALFYYFVESPQNSSTRPLVLWLNGGPGCSSLGYGAMEELGPFRVNGDGVSLYINDYAWNNEANVLFLESPAGVGFSYSNTTYHGVGDNSTAADSYKFLINWLERFPEYKTRDFFITGESYAGHYVPQLANTIVSENKIANQTIINLKGIAIGNAWIDATTGNQGGYDYLWTHALNSDETNAGIKQYCDFVTFKISDKCEDYMSQSDVEVGGIDPYNIYAPLCRTDESKPASSAGSVYEFDPCSDNYVNTYLNLPEVQAALHARPTQWSACRNVGYTDRAITVLPIIQDLIASGIRVWIYSGDVDSVVAVTTTRYAINTLNLKTKTPFRPWYSTDGEVGGYVIVYDALVFATVRGAGHEVPSYQPERALTLFSAFIRGAPLPSS